MTEILREGREASPEAAPRVEESFRQCCSEEGGMAMEDVYQENMHGCVCVWFLGGATNEQLASCV